MSKPFRRIVADLYKVRKGNKSWHRIHRTDRIYEKELQKALQDPKNRQALGVKNVLWIGREFRCADFFGIDSKWRPVFVETKISSQQKHLSKQLRTRVMGFVGRKYGNVAKDIFKYVTGRVKDKYLMEHGHNLRHLHSRGRLQKSGDVLKYLKRKMHRKPPTTSRVGRVRFIAVSPRLSDEFARTVSHVRASLKRRGRAGSFLVSAVITTPTLNKGWIAITRIEF